MNEETQNLVEKGRRKEVAELRHKSILTSGDECPTVFSHVWIREANKQVWTKSFLLLKDKKLYLSYKTQRSFG
ncbi:hypothetical protein RUM43_012957 [Polyplax serrata]|uniref:PH domain-containing protein n=1 Tax=Polyplax serrata TaxID=468196 RepID=A0AAN8P236_POLSC